MPAAWKRLTNAELGSFSGDAEVCHGEHAPDNDAHLTDSGTIHKHLALYGDTRATWWRPVAGGDPART